MLHAQLAVGRHLLVHRHGVLGGDVGAVAFGAAVDAGALEIGLVEVGHAGFHAQFLVEVIAGEQLAVGLVRIDGLVLGGHGRGADIGAARGVLGLGGGHGGGAGDQGDNQLVHGISFQKYCNCCAIHSKSRYGQDNS